MRALLLILIGALPVLAQGRDKPKFDVPDKKPDEKPTEEGEQARALRTALQRLAGWPSERARRAAEQLIVRREISLKLVVDVLMSEDKKYQKMKPGAAYVLGRIGDSKSFLMPLLVAAEKKQRRHAAVFLEAAWRLNPEAAVAEAFRFFHLSDTTLRREATKFVRDRISGKNLPAVLDLLDKQRSERPFTREAGLVLLDRLVSTKEVKWEDAGPRFYSVLGDDSPQVASRAMRILASRNEKDNITALNELITKKYSFWRQRSYAALALSILSSAFKVQPLSPETIEVLNGSRGLQHPKEMLAQASAALALGQAALREGDRELVRLLDRQIPITLIEAVGAGNRHYRDFASVMPLAYTMLRRITGQVFADQAPLWAKWWSANGHRFRARRELREIDKRDLQDTVVEIKHSEEDGAAAIRLSVVAERRPTFLYGRVHAMPAEEMAGLVQLLRESGFFAKDEADLAKIGREEMVLIVRIGDLQRAVAFPPSTEDNKSRNRIVARIGLLADRYSWQLWWHRKAQPSWALFFGENRKWFKEHTDEAERADRLRSMIAASLRDQLLHQDRVRAARAAAALPGGGKSLTEDQVAKFVAAVRLELEPNEFVATVVDMLVPAAGEKAANGLIDALAAKPDPRAIALLGRLSKSLATEQLSALSTDKRWNVRRAAVTALAEREGVRALLVARLKDTEVQVQVAAAEAMARRKETAVLPALQALATHTSSEVRATTAFAYGLLGGKRALSLIRPLLYRDSNARVRTRGIQGLVEGKDPGATDLLVGVFERETNSIVRAAASRGLVSLESPALVRSLMTRLEHTPAASPERVALVNVLARVSSDVPVPLLLSVLSGDDPSSADAAALGLARRWDDSAISQLIKMTEAGGSNARAAIRHLQMLSSYSNDAEKFERQASNYKAWYKVNSTGNPRTWFRDALNTRGYDTTPLGALMEGDGTAIPAVPDTAIPVLLRALREDDWYMRRNASFLLNRRIGAGAPKIVSYNTRRRELDAAVRAYADWWAAEEARIRKKKRG